MTRKIHVHLIDDLDASEASETVRFEVDGRPYEIDLSSQNAERFRAEIAPYIAHARKVVSYGRRRGRASLSRPHGVSPATRRRGVRPGRGHATDITDDGTTIPDHAGDLPVPAGLGSDIHHSPLRTGNPAVTSPPRSDLFGLPRPGTRTILSRRPGYRSLPLQTDSTRDIARYTNRLRDGVA